MSVITKVKTVFFLMTITVSAFAGWFAKGYFNGGRDVTKTNETLRVHPLERYALDTLSQTEIKPGKLEIKNALKEDPDYTSYLFELTFNPNLDGKTFKKTTGQINLPAQASLPSEERVPSDNQKYPLLVMFRGYINQEIYRTGDGTRNAAAFFAKNGFITISPDFLGYAGSDSESGNIFESRFQTYVTALAVLKSVNQITNWDGKNIFIWAHSNGSQIALTVLEISAVDYPTVLWAPVSKPFPYSILYYTDDSSDGGKLIRHELATFEKDYDVDKYSLTNYLDKINAPILVNQGTADDAIPKAWTDGLVANLRKLDKDVTYTIYPGANHDMRPLWDSVILDNLNYFASYLQ